MCHLRCSVEGFNFALCLISTRKVQCTHFFTQEIAGLRLELFTFLYFIKPLHSICTAQNIDYGYTLDHPCFGSRIIKVFTLVYPIFNITLGVKLVSISMFFLMPQPLLQVTPVQRPAYLQRACQDLSIEGK